MKFPLVIMVLLIIVVGCTDFSNESAVLQAAQDCCRCFDEINDFENSDKQKKKLNACVMRYKDIYLDIRRDCMKHDLPNSEYIRLNKIYESIINNCNDN